MKKNSKKKRSMGSGRKGQDLRKGYQTEDRDIQRYHADAREREATATSRENDWTWYAQSPQLVRDYASFPFGIPLGNNVNFGTSIPISNSSVPGLMTLYFVPTVGENLDPNSPVNIASRNIYSYVRHANSGHSNYEAPDLMLYLLAMDSVYTFRSMLTRVLGVINAYTPVNRFYPKALIEAMGINFDDIVQHIPDLRGFINQYGVKMGSMCVPASMPYFARHSWMCEGYYVDSSSQKAQTYMYTPSGFFVAALNSQNSLYELNYTPWFEQESSAGTYAQLKSFSELVTYGNNLINPILANEDFNIMSGDILKAFGPEGVIKVGTIPDGYLVLPSYNQEVQSQIENAFVLNGYYRCTVTQETGIGTGYLVTHRLGNASDMTLFSQVWQVGDAFSADAFPEFPQVSAQMNPYYGSNIILNFHHDNVTPEEVMVATRLANVPRIAGAQWASFPPSISSALSWSISIPTMGSEVIVSATVTYAVGGQYVTRRGFASKMFTIIESTDGIQQVTDKMQQSMTSAGLLSAFDWSPMVYPASITISPVSGGLDRYGPNTMYADIDNFTVIDSANLENMSLAALLSEFNIPQMGAFANK